jgi:hypothetical protein
MSSEFWQAAEHLETNNLVDRFKSVRVGDVTLTEEVRNTVLTVTLANIEKSSS